MTNYHILVIDDEEDICKQISEFFHNETINNGTLFIHTCENLQEALQKIDVFRYDIIIIDVKMGETDASAEAGPQILSALKQRRFTPVIFYTGLPKSVEALKSPFVKIIEKSAGLDNIQTIIEEIITGGLPRISQALQNRIDAIQRDYMWDFVTDNWETFNLKEPIELAYLLTRRLSMSLAKDNMQSFATEIGATTSITSDEKAHPIEYYIIPPVNRRPMTGNIFRQNIEDNKATFWLLLTPSCDFAQNKAKRVLLANCMQLEDHPTYTSWSKTKSNRQKEKLEKILGNRAGKQFFFLPKALSLPNLVVDLQHLVTVGLDKLKQFDHVASLDNPFAQEITSSFIQHFGRIGTPDLDVETIYNEIDQQIELSTGLNK